MRIIKLISSLGSIIILSSTLAQAQTQRLDDSASTRNRVNPESVTSESGELLTESRNPKFLISDFGRVQYRLATLSFKGQTAKIYYVIPSLIDGLTNPQALTLQWKGTGLFAEGQGHAGDRVLVWSGVINDDWLEEELDIQMQVELAHLKLATGQAFGFEAYFEIETIP